MKFTSKYLNSLKTLHSLKTLPHPNTLLENKSAIFQNLLYSKVATYKDDLVWHLIISKYTFLLQAPAIGCQWFSTTPFDDLVYSMQIALSRTFCIYEEVSYKVHPFVV